MAWNSLNQRQTIDKGKPSVTNQRPCGFQQLRLNIGHRQESARGKEGQAAVIA
jgi:hypothetical protein